MHKFSELLKIQCLSGQFLRYYLEQSLDQLQTFHLELVDGGVLICEEELWHHFFRKQVVEAGILCLEVCATRLLLLQTRFLVLAQLILRFEQVILVDLNFFAGIALFTLRVVVSFLSDFFALLFLLSHFCFVWVVRLHVLFSSRVFGLFGSWRIFLKFFILFRFLFFFGFFYLCLLVLSVRSHGQRLPFVLG